MQSLVAAQRTQARPALKRTALVCKAEVCKAEVCKAEVCKADGMGCKPRSQAAAQAMGGALTLRFQTRPEACSAAAQAWRMLHSGLRLRRLSASRSASTAPPIDGDRRVPHDAHALWSGAKGQIAARGAHIPESAEAVAGTAGVEAANAFCTPAAISLDRSNPPQACYVCAVFKASRVDIGWECTWACCGRSIGEISAGLWKDGLRIAASSVCVTHASPAIAVPVLQRTLDAAPK